MSSDHPDRNLLFGILAVQMDFVSRDALIGAMNSWVLDKSKPLAKILVEQGALRAADHDLLDPMVQRHIELHQNDPQQSLATLSSVSSLRHSLREITDPELQHSLDLLSRDAELARGDETTAAYHPDAGRRFRILHQHAQGGLGTVFVAYDEELHRKVALKEIQQQRAMDTASRARFLQEAEITGNLEHPGVVPVYGLGHYEDGRPFYAMRFIKGDSLRDATKHFHKKVASSGGEWRRVEMRRLLGRFVDVCDAIGYAHSRGVLHRDLKPGNIMVGKYGETLVVDWGLAKLMGDTDDQQREETALKIESDGSPIKTMPGAAVGTPSYMSPEQVGGQLDQLTESSDIYGLGATLYYILTCHPPVTGTSTEQVLEHVKLGDVAPPRAVKPDVPRPLDAICMKALARLPAQRYASCRALANDVEAYLADTPVSAYRGVFYRGRLWLHRHRTAVIAACVLLACLAGFSGFVAMRQWKTARQIKNHTDRAGWAVESNDLAKGMAELSAARALAASDPVDARRIDRWLKQLKDYRDFESRYDEMRLGVSWSSDRSPGTSEKSATTFNDPVAKHARSALQSLAVLDNPDWIVGFNDSLLSQQQLTGLREHVGEMIVQLALRIAYKWNDDDESRDRTRQAFGLLEEASACIEFGTGIHSLQALWQRRLGEDEKVDSNWDQALEIAKEGATDKYSVFDQYVLAQVADAMLLSGRDSVSNGPKVLQLYQSVLKRDPAFFRAHFGMYSVYGKMSDVAGQLRHLEACLALAPDVAVLYYFRGMLHFAQGSSDPIGYQRAYDDFDASVQRDPNFARGYFYRGRMNVVMGKWAEAVRDFDQAIDHDPSLDSAYHWRAIGRAKIGMYRQAAADAEEAVKREPDDRLILYYAARAYAQSVRAVQQSELSADERDRLAKTYADRCLELLAQAFAAGYDQLGRLVPGSDFDPVYGVADIRTLIERRCEKLLENPPNADATSSAKRTPVPRGEFLLVLGDLAKSAEQWDEALDWYEKSQAEYMEAIKQKRLPSSGVKDLLRAMSGRVAMLDRLEQFDKADASFRLMLRLRSKAEPQLRIERALALLDVGHQQRAVETVRSLNPEKLDSRLDLYDLACVYARATGAVKIDPAMETEKKNELVDQYSGQAISCLRSAHAKLFFFRSPAKLEHLKTDSDLDPIRNLPAFQTLVDQIEREQAETTSPNAASL